MNISLVMDSWVCLGIAILFGVFGTVSMKLSHGFRKLRPSLYMAFFYTISFSALTFAMKYLDLSVVYAVWSGVGTALVTLIGIFYLQEKVSLRKVFCLILIIVGIIGIHLSDNFIS